MKIPLSQFRNIVLILALILVVAGVSYCMGENHVTTGSLKLGVAGTGGGSTGATITNQNEPSDIGNVDFSLFWEVWDRLGKTYLEKQNINAQKMVWGAISGMTSSLGDPYTMFLPPSENKSSKEDLNGSFDGVGIQLGYKDGANLAVMSPLSGMPAEKAGVKAGDLILHIKDSVKSTDRDSYGLSLPEAVNLIRGPKGSTVTLTLVHEGANEPYSIDLKRETIVVPSVEIKTGTVDSDKWVETKDNGNPTAKFVVWLKLSRFGDLTDSQWDEAVSKIQTVCKISASNCKGVVLDLRNNPGGYLQSSVNLAGEFLDQGKLVVTQANADGSKVDYKVERIGRLVSIPLVVLVNGGSASASEIMSGALRDWGRAKLVGEKTFGKGTVQEAMDLRQGAGLHVTVAKWLLPKGQWINKIGITPDIEVKPDEKNLALDIQLVRAAQELLK